MFNIGDQVENKSEMSTNSRFPQDYQRNQRHTCTNEEFPCQVNDDCADCIIEGIECYDDRGEHTGGFEKSIDISFLFKRYIKMCLFASTRY